MTNNHNSSQPNHVASAPTNHRQSSPSAISQQPYQALPARSRTYPCLQTMGNDPRILDWLESVLPVPYDEEPSPRPRKRARPNSDRHRHASTDQKYIVVDGSNRSRLPTPSASCSPTASRSRAHGDAVGVDPIKLMASKRRRDRTGGLGDGEEQSDLDVTPRGADRSTRYTGFGGSNAFSQTPSLQSSSQLSPSKASKASKVSNSSSPTRQIRNAELQDTGFIKASFQSNEQPDSLKSLAETFRKIGDGFGILPRSLYDQVSGSRLIQIAKP